MVNKNQKYGNLIEVTIIRCWAVLSLVIWHTFCACRTIDPISVNAWYSYIIFRLIPDANMPLFTFISGYLFYFLFVERGKYQDFNSFWKNKVDRLLIPFFILGLVTNITEYGKDIRDMLYGGPSHLWYCLMLFYCFIICWVVERKVGSWLNVVLMLCSLGLSLFFTGVWDLWIRHAFPGGWEFVAYYYGYFYMGYLAYKYRDKIMSKWLIPIWLILYGATCYVNSNMAVLISLRCIAYIMLIFTLFRSFDIWITWSDKTLNITNAISKCSFGIYVFHQWILWNLSHIPTIATKLYDVVNAHFLLVNIIGWISVFLISFLLTNFLLKTKLGRYLFL